MDLRRIVAPILLVSATILGGCDLKPNEVYLYLEAERFDSVGGWTIDAQFRQIMGSTYLLAAGAGVPVEDAETQLDVPRAGTYYLWVRCKDWHETAPGGFEVSIDELPSATTFGTQKKGWAWIEGGDFKLTPGKATVKLHDLTGYYGRCDAILLTTDKDFRPPDDVRAIGELRKKLLGDPAPEALDYDFVVIGAGYGGICSAIQAGRLGLKTALVQDRPCLGGNASKEVNVGPGGACPHTCRFRETGICEEIGEGRVREGVKEWSTPINLVVKGVPNLTVYLNTQGMRAVCKKKGHIDAVEAENVVSGKKYLFRAPIFADCTGDGTIAFTAGAEYRHGQEARKEFNESIAPEKPNPNTMGTSIIHHSTRMATPQPFTPPPFAVKFTAEYFTRRKSNLVSGNWWIEYGGMRDTIKDAEEIRDELIRVIFGAFDWAKNHDPETRDLVANYKLDPVPTVGGKRESRRIIGDYILTQNDVQKAVLFPDRVAYGGWPIDLHPSPGIYGKDIPPAIFNHLKQIHNIPYRILYTRDVDNLFMAGRHVSVTHVALGTTRLEQTIGLEGQAVGTAAYLCKKYGILPRAVNPAHIKELQQLILKWDVYLVEVPNEDPGDLCRGAKVSASSAAPDNGFGSMGASESRKLRDAPCTSARGQTIGSPQPGVKEISLNLCAEGGPVEARLHVEKGALQDKRQPVEVATAQVKSAKFQWIKFKLGQPLEPQQLYFVWLETNPKLCWRINDGSYGERAYGKPDDWKASRGSYLIQPIGTPVRLGKVGPEAAVDGMSWPLGDECHQWRSDPTKGLPQWFQADFGKTVKLNTVYLTFDTNIFGRFPVSRPGFEATAQDYRLLYNDGGRWKTAFEEKGNWRRFRRHGFEPISTDKIRLEILKAKNFNEARLYEIRAYNE